jgi:hypothetical protein
LRAGQWRQQTDSAPILALLHSQAGLRSQEVWCRAFALILPERPSALVP